MTSNVRWVCAEKRRALQWVQASCHAGQVCVSTQRIYVHADREHEFLERFTARVAALKIGYRRGRYRGRPARHAARKKTALEQGRIGQQGDGSIEYGIYLSWPFIQWRTARSIETKSGAIILSLGISQVGSPSVQPFV
jgi:hypothetical protein